MALVLEKHIEITEGVRGGKPRLAGTRITVSDVVIWHLRLGQSLEEIAVSYDLSLSSVYAAIAYYYDHKEEIDAEIEAGRAYYETMKRQSPSLLKEKLESQDRD
ncbi:MAG: DUF433 domain-containing protein [Chloroflexi bacterium]|nr:DUF433 domain-containing protein [Chloroflexota bacterium]MCI0579136.1 DUF433 domain-containing protein [Chloroflexota bacterium]MCI0643353.1 DUF433 domain-containing protein [Chloroflexota bacterium]MCI0728332.1 DUF433 domain-containing protein [Chloroflexota bacterium]